MQTPVQSMPGNAFPPAFPPIAELVPHSASMLLIDRVVAADDDSLQAEVDIAAGAMFCGEDGVGSWIGVEYMAQAVAAFAGLQARRHAMRHGGASEAPHAAPKIGFLLGSRRYTASRGHFAPGSTLRIHVQRLLQADNGLGSFDCFIADGGERIATATLTVFQPPDVAAFLDEGAV